jgi:hypothetical protein
VVGPSNDGRCEARVLSVSLELDGAVGRPRIDRVHRRQDDRRRARSQWSASLALLRDEGRFGDHGIGSRRARGAPGRYRREGSLTAGPHVSRRHRAGPHRR